MLKTVFFDISGVLLEGNIAIDGAVDAINKIQQSKLIIRFVTNTARKTSAQIYNDLIKHGFKVKPTQIFSAPSAVHQYLKTNQLRPFLLIHDNLLTDFDDIEQNNANAVVIGDAADGFNYQNLNKAFQLCQQGAKLIGIGDNKYFKNEQQLQLDAGPFIHAIADAADVKPTIIGKPSKDFYQQVLVSCDVKSEECLMVGDDVFGDVEGAINSGLQACLVKTGKYQAGDENRVNSKFLCVNSVVDAINYALNQVSDN